MDLPPQDDDVKMTDAETPHDADEAAEAPDEEEEEAGEVVGALSFPSEVAVLPVRNLVVFPGTVVPLTIGREKSQRLIDAVLAGDKLVAAFTQRDESVDDPGIDDVYRVGTITRILKLLRMPDGTNNLLVHGLARVGLERFIETEPFWRAVVHPHEDEPVSGVEIDALSFSARRAAEQVIELSPNVPDEARVMLANIEEPGPLADFLAANLSLGVVPKQELLETFDITERLRKVNVSLNNQLDLLKLSSKIQSDVRQQIDKTQRQYYLQEQLKAIQKELGETDAHAREIDEIRQRVDAVGMPDEVRKEADRELQRLDRIPQSSPEYGVARDYLEWLCDMPWRVQTEDNLDLRRAERILNEDHYGLDKIKRRILEFLAVRKLNPEGKSPILCFAGPPGVGKTSLGQSIARALGRKFIRIALGGVRDEADIRGHRRTYIGAIPGRLVQEIRKAGSRNPVLMLDELDKVGADFRGDPASALLEVLDPAQNHRFSDHYLDVPFDLSRVLFIGTANYMDPVAPALKDRMEIISLAGYTTAEKMQIAKRYLVGRQMEANGLAGQGIRFSDEALRAVIEKHTREAGVRNLERCIGAVCRAVAAKVAANRKTPKTIRAMHLSEALGPARYESEAAMRAATPGVVTGLAYTPVGGEIMFVEAVSMPGRGGFSLTGQIGDVMKESAHAALSLMKARAAEWGVDVERVQERDVHIHVPAGGIPKDGPSAGVAMFTALVSLHTGLIAEPSIGMTGEITLRGNVLPIGGVKEKVLAAHRAGLKTVILPKRNEPDLYEVPSDVRADLKFVFAQTIEDVLRAALPEGEWKRAGRGSRRSAKKSAKKGSKPAAKRKSTPARPASAAAKRPKRASGPRRSRSA